MQVINCLIIRCTGITIPGSESASASVSKRFYFKFDPDSDADADPRLFPLKCADNYETVNMDEE